ncbi:hypothetical protein DMENIID0001_150350 [Sergentomyia squamirostris]
MGAGKKKARSPKFLREDRMDRMEDHQSDEEKQGGFDNDLLLPGFTKCRNCRWKCIGFPSKIARSPSQLGGERSAEVTKSSVEDEEQPENLPMENFILYSNEYVIDRYYVLKEEDLVFKSFMQCCPEETIPMRTREREEHKTPKT